MEYPFFPLVSKGGLMVSIRLVLPCPFGILRWTQPACLPNLEPGLFSGNEPLWVPVSTVWWNWKVWSESYFGHIPHVLFTGQHKHSLLSVLKNIEQLNEMEILRDPSEESPGGTAACFLDVSSPLSLHNCFLACVCLSNVLSFRALFSQVLSSAGIPQRGHKLLSHFPHLAGRSRK